MRLNKQGMSVRVQDLIVVCRPVGGHSDHGIPVGGNKNYPDMNFRSNYCDGSNDKMEKKLSTKNGIFDEITCFDFTLSAELPSLSLKESNYLAIDNYKTAENTGSQLFLKHLLCSSSLNCLVNRVITPMQQRNGHTLSHTIPCRNHHTPWTIMVPQTSKDLRPKLTMEAAFDYGSSSTISTPVNLNEPCSSSAALNININEERHECNIEARSVLTITNSDRNINQLSLTPFDSSLEGQSHSTMASHATTRSNHTNQVPDFSGTLDHCVLMDTLPDQPHVALDELAVGESYMSCDSESSCHSVTDFTFSKSSTEDKVKTAAEKMANVAQPRNSLKAKIIKTFIKNVRDNNGLYLTNNRSDLTDDSISDITDYSITDPNENSISDLTDDNRSMFTDISLSDLTDDNSRSNLTDNSLSDFTDSDNYRSDFVDNRKSELFILYENLLPSNYYTQRQSQQASEYGQINNYFLGQSNADKHIDNIVSSNLSSISQMENLSSISQMENLSSISQMENLSSSQITKNMKTSECLNTSPIISTVDTFSRNSICKHNIQTDDAQSTFTSNSSLCNRKSEIPKISHSSSSTCSHQDFSTVSAKTAYVLNLPASNSQIPTSTSSSTFEYFTPINNNKIQNSNTTDDKNMSFLIESTILQSQSVGKNNKVSSKMTNKNSDPFLSEASFSDMNPKPGTDMFDDLTSAARSVNSPLLSSVTSQHVSTTGQNKLSNLIDNPPSMSHAFMDSSESIVHASFGSECLNELDSFLNTNPLSPCMTTTVNSSTSIQPISVSEWTKSDAVTNQGSELVSTDSSDSETSSKPSLLRTLLNKEGLAVHGPQTYTEWVLEQIPQKYYDIKKTNRFNETTNSRQMLSAHRKRKSVMKKSRELPKLYMACGRMQFGTYGFQDQKATKELPLPSSIKAVVTTQPSHQTPHGIPKSGFVHKNDTSDRDITNHISSSDTCKDFSLPDDLLDMAMEYCAPLEMGQAEALISDLNGTCSWEDNLFSLLEASGQEKPVNVTGCLSTPQQSVDSVSSRVISMSHESTSNFSILKENLAKPSVPTSMSLLQNNTKSKEESMGMNLYHPETSFSQAVISPQHLLKSLKPSTKIPYNLKLPTLSTADSTNINRKMSLLRAAIISPDVDKLIEQIPFANAKKQACSSQPTPNLCENDPDIVITQVVGLQKSQVLPSVQISHGKVNKVTCGNKIRPAENTYKSVHSSNNSTTLLRHKDTTSLGRVFTTGLSITDNDMRQQLQNVPVPADPATAEESPSSNPLVIKISLGTNSAKIVTEDGCSQNRLTHKLKSTCQHSLSGHVSPSYSRTRISNTDLSSTHPVSVMIMRKENHRSRRSKSIAIQTDNLPGEIYPEFEHNPTDNILYPSVIISYPPVVSLGHDDSQFSTSNSSQSSMSEIDKLLLNQSNCDDSLSSADNDHHLRSSSSSVNENDELRSSSSSVNENDELRSSSSFLLKLLTGELSKDHYRRLDQQLLEKERKKSVEL